MSTKFLGKVVTVARQRVLPEALPGIRAAGIGLAVAMLSLTANIVLLVLAVVSLALIPALGLGFALFPIVMTIARPVINTHRRLARLAGVDIPVPYRQAPNKAMFGTWSRFRITISDPATWRDFAWFIPGTVAGTICGLVAVCLPLYGLEGAAGVPFALFLFDVPYGYGIIWPTENFWQALITMPQGAVLLIAGLVGARWLVWLNASFARLFLAPTKAAELALRVRDLTVTRTQTLDSQAAELRRIERDLHDGAQARIVSLGMSIGLAKELVHTDPATAGHVLAEARHTSGEALKELRNLVRGIHPPVLAERGLAGAVRALALAMPLPTNVTIDVPGRPPPPIESALYFAIAETLTNITRHSGASSAWITLRCLGECLRVTVADNGHGNANVTGGTEGTSGTGLRGIERRLAAFDGTMKVFSPLGGPTVIIMELTCELSSPKTSPSSETV